MNRVIIESPLSENIGFNIEYARLCMKDSLDKGESPFLSHLLYTQVLDDTVPEERKIGIDAGLNWQSGCDFIAVYTDLGITEGMQMAIDRAKDLDIKVVYRKITSGMLCR